MIRVPLGLTFQASRCVSAGIGAIGCGYIDIGFLLVLYFIPLLLAFYYFFHSPAESVGDMSQVSERIYTDEYQAGRTLEQLVRLREVHTTPGRRTAQH